MKEIRIAIGLVIFIILGSVLAVNKMHDIHDLSSCFVKGSDGDYAPAKIQEILLYGYRVKTKHESFSGDLKVEESYYLFDDFKKTYRPADCYIWDITEQKQ